MEKAKVLFLCTGNSARSQMAEGMLRHLAADKFNVASAGTKPAGLNPLAVEAMREIGIDISNHQSKDVAQLLGTKFSWVITVCNNAKETCPIFPFTFRSLHWNLDDPAAAEGSHEEKLAVFRRIRNEIEANIHEFLKQVG
jgi:arsenate reductase